jgi:hypothetical protein
MNKLVKDVQRLFLLCLNSKACYYFNTQRRNIINLERLKSNHRTIIIESYYDNTMATVERILPDRTRFVTSYNKGFIIRIQYNRAVIKSGLYESWRNQEPFSRAFFQDDMLENLNISYIKRSVGVYHRGELYRTYPLSELDQASTYYQSLFSQ